MNRFMKVKDIKYNIIYPWMFWIENDESIENYLKMIQSEFVKAFWNFIESDTLMPTQESCSRKYFKSPHCRTQWANLITTFMEIYGSSYITASNVLEVSLLNSIHNLINQGCYILINKNMGIMPFDDNHEIVDEVYLEEAILPCLSEDDIKIMQWPNGTHWYAKVGTFDVYDDLGNMKWNNYKEAEKHAKKYFEKYRNYVSREYIKKDKEFQEV